jgi:C4-dicarboxylate-specific signal transduction histidine kinase
VDLNSAIARSLELIRGRLDRHHIHVVQNLGELPPIVCAPAQINQVILNLLLNAQHAILETGRSGGRIEIATQANRREVVLEITDDGCGIPQEIHSRIFDAFFTTKPVGEGTGLVTLIPIELVVAAVSCSGGSPCHRPEGAAPPPLPPEKTALDASSRAAGGSQATKASM